MKRFIWKAAVTCGLALCISSDGLSSVFSSPEDTPDPTVAQVGRGGQKGGQQPGGGGRQGGAGPGGIRQGGAGGGNGPGAGRGNPGAGRAQAPRGVAGGGGRGGIHAPSTNGPRNTVRGGPVAGANRSPSFSRPSVRPGLGQNRQPIVRHSNPGRGVVFGSGASRPNPSFSGRETAQDRQRLQRDLNTLQRQRNTQQIRNARIGDRPFRGNSIQLNNRAFSVGSNRYQPSHYRHSGYHGYWNGNRRLSNSANVINAVAYGLGAGYSNGRYGYGNNGYYSGYGNYNGYGSGWGWGLGSGYRGSRGYRSYTGYGYRPIGWGLGGWGLGSLNYSSGYLGYSNPYYINSGTTVYNYTQPIPVSYNTTVEVNEADASSAETVLTSAIDAFRLNDYDQALDIANKGISQYSDDAVLHEFRALVLFAKQDYQQAAATIHSVLAVGPGWDWTTLIGMYSDANLYTEQLRSLEAFTKSNPQDAASQFLLGYHYMTCGHPESAARSFQRVVTQLPADRVAVELLQMITPEETAEKGTDATLASSPAPVDGAAEVDVKPVDPKILVGAWSSSRDDGSAFKLNLTDDAKFTWSFTPKDQPEQEFGGTYTVEQNVLVLERKDGGSLIAEVTPEPSGNFNFRLLGAAESDKGLEFTK